jgi:hypothetical protein
VGRGGERDGTPVATTATRWDTTADAEKFEAAYRLSLVRRFGPARPAPSHHGARARPDRTRAQAPPGTIRRPDGTTIVVERRSRDVDVVDGVRPDEIEPLLAMLRTAMRTPRPARADSAASAASAASEPGPAPAPPASP